MKVKVLRPFHNGVKFSAVFFKAGDVFDFEKAIPWGEDKNGKCYVNVKAKAEAMIEHGYIEFYKDVPKIEPKIEPKVEKPKIPVKNK